MTTTILTKDLEKQTFDILQSIDSNCEENEKNIISRIDTLEKHLVQTIYEFSSKTKPLPKYKQDDDDEEQEHEDEEQEHEDENEQPEEEEEEPVDELNRSMSEKFDIPKNNEHDNEQDNRILDKVVTLEKISLDALLRIEGLETSVKNIYNKLNELTKVNNAILRCLEGGATFKTNNSKKTA